MGSPGDSDGKESACNARDLGSITGSGKSLWGQRSLMGYSPQGRIELHTAEWLTLS